MASEDTDSTSSGVRTHRPAAPCRKGERAAREKEVKRAKQRRWGRRRGVSGGSVRIRVGDDTGIVLATFQAARRRQARSPRRGVRQESFLEAAWEQTRRDAYW